MGNRINSKQIGGICQAVYGSPNYHLVKKCREDLPDEIYGVGFLDAPFEVEEMIAMITFWPELGKFNVTFYNAIEGWNMDDSIYGMVIERLSKVCPELNFSWGTCSQVKDGEDYEICFETKEETNLNN